MRNRGHSVSLFPKLVTMSARGGTVRQGAWSFLDAPLDGRRFWTATMKQAVPHTPRAGGCAPSAPPLSVRCRVLVHLFV